MTPALLWDRGDCAPVDRAIHSHDATFASRECFLKMRCWIILRCCVAQGLWFPRQAKLVSLFCAIWLLLASFQMNNLTSLEKQIMKNTLSNNKSRFLSILVILAAILSPIAVHAQNTYSNKTTTKAKTPQ